MSTEKTREEFEAFAIKRNAELIAEGHSLKSTHLVKNFHYPIWQASRAAIEVELPPEWAPVSERDDGANEMREHCVSAIESLGLKVKT